MVIENWEHIQNELDERHELIRRGIKQIEYIEKSKRAIIASTDLFIEKAQVQLTRIAKYLMILGLIALVLSILISMYCAIHISGIISIMPMHNDGMNSIDLIVFVIRSGAFGAFSGGIVYFLVQLSKSLFHESIVLYNRRHALRFGRLYMYSADKNFNLDDMQKAFKWTDEFDTAFKHIKTDGIASNAAISGSMDIIKLLVQRKDVADKEKNKDEKS